MFTRLDRYILGQLTVALLAVTLALVALIWLTQSLKFVELVVNRGLSLSVFLQLTSLLIPSFVAIILPITTFVVVQFVYQRLAGGRPGPLGAVTARHYPWLRQYGGRARP
jgi:lipopolysaccharide export system permease protein